MALALKQSAWIPKPTLTEENLPDQTGKVHIVTGGYAGVGFELSKILYAANATLYIAGRSQDKALKAIEGLKSHAPSSKGRAEFLNVDFSDLNTIKPAAEQFLSKEQRLDVLTNNAGVMVPPAGSKDKHGHELQIGTNILGPYLFSTLLIPILKQTAASAPPNSVRVTWPGSIAVDLGPKGGVVFDAEGNIKDLGISQTYAESKSANVFLASEFAKRHFADGSGVVSVSYNPGNLRTELTRHVGWFRALFVHPILYPAKFGAYTELYSGWSADLTTANQGAFIRPWGRIMPNRADIDKALKTEAEGGTGEASKTWDYCEKETAQYK